MQTLTTDEIIQEIHMIRQEHANRFDFDIQRIIADLKKSEQIHTEQGWLLLQEQQKTVSNPTFQRFHFVLPTHANCTPKNVV